MKQEIGCIMRYTSGDVRFKFHTATFTRTINSRGDKIRSKMLLYPINYEDIVFNAQIMKGNDTAIVICEPFLLDDELKEKCTKWVERANKADPKEYDLFDRLD